MARISGVDLPNNKQAVIALTSIFGIGRVSARKILIGANVPPEKKAADLTSDEVNAIRKIIDAEFTVEGDLRRDVAMSIKRLVDLNCYRGIRHRKGLPVRGQRTKTNARTRKGPRKTVANKKKAPTLGG